MRFLRVRSRQQYYLPTAYDMIRWHAAGVWRWDISDPTGNCGICHFPFDASCPQCKIPGDQCALCRCCCIQKVIVKEESLLTRCNTDCLPPLPCMNNIFVVIGKCTHCFHLHCISQWLRVKESEERCPMDRKPFGKELQHGLSSIMFLYLIT